MHTHTHTHTCSTHTLPTTHKGKWEGELQATKEVCLGSRLDRMNRVCLPDGPGQGIPLGRDDISEGSLAVSPCFTVLWAQEQQEMIHSPIKENKMEWVFFANNSAGELINEQSAGISLGATKKLFMFCSYNPSEQLALRTAKFHFSMCTDFACDKCLKIFQNSAHVFCSA